jgi:hypothetical protein
MFLFGFRSPAQFVLKFGPAFEAGLPRDDELGVSERRRLGRLGAECRGQPGNRDGIAGPRIAQQGLGLLPKIIEIVRAERRTRRERGLEMADLLSSRSQPRPNLPASAAQAERRSTAS